MVGAEKRRAEPRRFLINPTDFGLSPGAGWKPETGIGERIERVFAYHQHLAVCVIRDMFMIDPVGELARRIKKAGLAGTVSEVYLRRKIYGELTASKTDLIVWALATENISILPAASTLEELLPPVGDIED